MIRQMKNLELFATSTVKWIANLLASSCKLTQPCPGDITVAVLPREPNSLPDIAKHLGPAMPRPTPFDIYRAPRTLSAVPTTAAGWVDLQLPRRLQPKRTLLSFETSSLPDSSLLLHGCDEISRHNKEAKRYTHA